MKNTEPKPKSQMKAKFDYRFLAIWMALGNIIQFITSVVGENTIKSLFDGRIWALLFIFAIPLLSYFFGKTERALRREASIKKNDTLLSWGGNVSFLLVIIYLVFSI